MITLKELQELEAQFYGEEDDDFEGGVMEENDECAEWARRNVGRLFDTLRHSLSDTNEVQSKEAQ